MKKLSEMTEEEANSFVSSLAAMYKNNTKVMDDGLEPHISEEEAKALQEWEDNGKKGEPPAVFVKWKKRY